MNHLNNKKLTVYAQRLRREMTKEERRLWYDCLKQLPFTVNRQKVIGRYIADFYIAAAHLAIEVDGTQHTEDDHMLADQARDRYLESKGVRVLRFTNLDINQRFQSVCQAIEDFLPDD